MNGVKGIDWLAFAVGLWWVMSRRLLCRAFTSLQLISSIYVTACLPIHYFIKKEDERQPQLLLILFSLFDSSQFTCGGLVAPALLLKEREVKLIN